MSSIDIDLTTGQARNQSAVATPPVSGAPTRPSATRRQFCATPDRRSSAGRFNPEGGSWDRRSFRYAFSTGPGSSGTLTQTLSFADAKAAVTRAFTTWSTQGGVELHFAE